jgi:hypothetical protein
MNKVLILAVLVLASCTPQTTYITHPNQYGETDTIATLDVPTTSIPDTTTELLVPLFPVPITRVTKVNRGEYKWEVESENGVVFYSNKKYKVGDVAFYMDSETEKLYWTKK